jgi:hypothetical protein
MSERGGTKQTASSSDVKRTAEKRFLIGLALAYAKDWSMLVREVNIKNIFESSTAFEV